MDQTTYQIQKNIKDPLAILTEWNNSSITSTLRNNSTTNIIMNHGKKSYLKAPPKPVKIDQEKEDGGGGFLPTTYLPDRFARSQQELMVKYQNQEETLLSPYKKNNNNNNNKNKATTTVTTTGSKPLDITSRRRPTKSQSVWNIIDENDREQQRQNLNQNKNSSSNTKNVENDRTMIDPDKVCSSCHPKDGTGTGTGVTGGFVEIMNPNSTRKSHDATSANETWGNKDRDNEIMNQYGFRFDFHK